MAAAMAASPPLELILIVAATRTMGIGANGTLPWQGLRREMAFFARVTKRVPAEAAPTAVNAVIMGRRTWESIPARFRPLPGRVNLVLTSRALAAPEPGGTAPSLDAALDAAWCSAAAAGGRVFVIGGAAAYAAAVRTGLARRILLTRVLADFDCDVTFPLPLGTDGADAIAADRQLGRWRQCSKQALDRFVGEDVPEGVQVENEVPYQFEMWERVD